MAFERVILYGLTLVDRRKVSYARVNPVEARDIFIRSALVAGELSGKHAFLDHNLSRYPQLVVEEFNIYDQAALGEWLAGRAGRAGDFHAPALFVGDQAWIGEKEITPATVAVTLDRYAATGAAKTWSEFDPSQANTLQRFRSMGWLTVVFAGLVDGLNPCAFATLVFFISYLTMIGGKRKEILMVGMGFSVSSFVTHLLLGVGILSFIQHFSFFPLFTRVVYLITFAFSLRKL